MPVPRDYNEVQERIAGFNEQYPDGRIVTSIVAQEVSIEDVELRKRESGAYRQPLAKGYVTVRAEVYKSDAPGVAPAGVGHSTMLIPGITQYTRDSELENAETSAVGRALAFIGFYAKGESLASKQEIATKKGQGDLTEEAKKVFKDEAEQAVVGQRGLTDEQRKLLFATLRTAGVSEDTRKAELSQILGRTIRSVKDMTSDDLDIVIKYFAQ